MTTGGTESIILACLSARNHAQAKHGIRDPVVVVPVTAHAAFDKVGQILTSHTYLVFNHIKTMVRGMCVFLPTLLYRPAICWAFAFAMCRWNRRRAELMCTRCAERSAKTRVWWVSY